MRSAGKVLFFSGKRNGGRWTKKSWTIVFFLFQRIVRKTENGERSMRFPDSGSVAVCQAA